jgi:hypothetical protein
MRRSLPHIVVVSGLFLVPACGPAYAPVTLSDIDSGFTVLVTNAAVRFTVVGGATVKALGATTTSDRGDCELPNMPFATISVTVTHPNFVELTRAVVKKKNEFPFYTFEIHPK